MTAWIDAFLPTFGLIGLGWWLRRTLLPEDQAWAGIETLTFWILLPALLASSIATVDLGSLPVGRLAGAIWGTLLLATASARLLARLLRLDHAGMTSVVQGGIRFNNYIAFAIAGGVFGPGGVALAGVVAGLIVPFVQVVLTLVFVLGTRRRTDPLRLARQIALNPLLLGCVAGFGFAAMGGMPAGLGPFARQLGQAAVALGLLCVGAGLSLGALRDAPATQALVAVQKLVLVPAVTFSLGSLLAIAPLPLAVATLVMAMPTATTAYIMARAMGGDHRLMAAMITLQHVVAIVTVPLWALFLARGS